MGRRRAGGTAARAGEHNAAAAYLRRRHYIGTARAGFIVFAVVEFIGGTAAYISSRVHDTLGIGLPVIDPVVPLTIGGSLGLLGLCCYGVVLRPRSVAADDGARSVPAPRGGARWPGADAAGLGRVTSGTGPVT